MVVLSCSKNLAHGFKVDQVLGIKHVQFSIELQDLLFTSIELDLIKVDWSCARNSLTCLFLRTQELIHHLVVRWWCLNLSGCIRQRVLAQELNNLLSVRSTQSLPRAELIGDFRIVRSVVARQLSVDTIT